MVIFNYRQLYYKGLLKDGVMGGQVTDPESAYVSFIIRLPAVFIERIYSLKNG